jgi:hypothetical protein
MWGGADSTNRSVIVAEYIEANIEYASSDIMGRVSGGALKVLCHIRPAHERITKRGSRNRVIMYERFDAGYDMDGERVIRGSWYCVLAYLEPTSKL